MKPNQDFDSIVDQALAHYRDAEPLSGLDDRVLQRVAVQTGKRRLAGWWAITALAAAAALIAIWFGVPRSLTPSSISLPTIAQQAAPQTSSHVVPRVTVRHAPHRNKTLASTRQSTIENKRDSDHLTNPETAAGRVPVQPQFPSPAPITPQEHALLALTRTAPDALVNRNHDLRDLEIAPIEIKPLAEPTGASQGDNQ